MRRPSLVPPWSLSCPDVELGRGQVCGAHAQDWSLSTRGAYPVEEPRAYVSGLI
ncbi:hypothetical protein [Streptomyces albipurpureus]|uniref:Uncharacterized protein n=1 Tax=Streptomyces albipurpureus TaxID=2897419 RepID=A0ABT0UR61_9ACTN|nr:hypothetical protein [Streptomyces sp. CWNU-1]MCM2391099.1 hypothetical protein [Streptomyces sp. CWNU-1]